MSKILTLLFTLIASAAVIWYLLLMGQSSTAAYDMKNPQTPTDSLLTGGQPSKGDLAKVQSKGYRTVINLRLPNEFDDFDEAAEVDALGMTYIEMPINMRGDLNAQSAIQFDKLLTELRGPIYAHCGTGDRVGALYALRAHHVQGKSAEEAIAIGKTAGLNRLEGMVRGMLGVSGSAH